MKIQVAWSPEAGDAREATVELADGATLLDAVAAAGLSDRSPLDVGIWGRPASPDELLKEGDRVELYRPLALDPKEARRRRARR